MAKRNMTNDKQLSTKHYTENNRLRTTNPTKNRALHNVTSSSHYYCCTNLLPDSLDCPFMIAPSVFSNLYIHL